MILKIFSNFKHVFINEQTYVFDLQLDGKIYLFLDKRLFGFNLQGRYIYVKKNPKRQILDRLKVNFIFMQNQLRNILSIYEIIFV